MIHHKQYHNLLQFHSLNKFDSLFHFTTTRLDGASRGNYNSFNLSLYSGDDMNDVDENRKKLASIAGISEDALIVPYQTHGDKILIIDNSFLSKSDLEQSKLLHGIDALITNQPDICIGVTTADCVPVLVYDPVLKVFAAVHAGWKGTVSKLVAKTVFKMVEMYSCRYENLIVGIGPFISQQYFEVGDEVVTAFSEAGFDMNIIRSINDETSKSHLDLGKANKQLLIELGVRNENIETTSYCSYREADIFFSARRQGLQSGRMLTGGCLR